jgi:hypothetical protein
MGDHRTDNGEWMLRAQRATLEQMQAQNPYLPYLTPRAWSSLPPEDTTGLKMLDEFLAKRKGERE